MKNKFFIIIVTIFIGIFTGYLYNEVVISHPKSKFKEYKKMVYLEEKGIAVDFNLSQDFYLLKTKHIIQENQPKEIFVNGIEVRPKHITRKGIIETGYIYIPKEIIKEGRNSIDIYFPKNRPPDVDIILSNYRKQIGSDIYILFFDSPYFSSASTSFRQMVWFTFLIFLLFAGMIYFLSRILFLSLNRLWLYQIYSLLPFILFMITLWVGNNVGRLYRAVITPKYFLTFGTISFFIIESSIILEKLKVIDWIISKKFSDKCILLFIVLLILCALLLFLDLDPIVIQLANIAYFALVIGVIIKFAIVKKEAKGSVE